MKPVTIRIGMGSCGIAAGAQEVFDAVQEYLAKGQLQAKLEKTGCVGMCSWEPLLEVHYPEAPSRTFGNVTAEQAIALLDAWKNFQDNGGDIPGAVIGEAPADETVSHQNRIVLRNTGIIDPESLDDYLARDGYKAAEKAIKTMTREQVIDSVLKSGLRGRGGAGFPTGLKWKFAFQERSDKKYIVCNADEGDPGAFMDRSVLEGDPHSVIEGMIIGAYAIGADEGYVYVRAEYPLAVKNLTKALADAEARGFLGKGMFGSDFNFDLHIKEGAGAFVCGEETALMQSIEGKRGMPKIRPPFPAQSGLWGKPTNINNVETFANVAWIINNGWEKFAALGTEKSKGTKVFALAGKIKYPGLIEVPMGTSLRDVIYGVGGGMATEKPFKAAQLGGPSGGCVPRDLLDTIVDYDSINSTGAIMGSGGMVVMDEGTCMVDIAKFFLNFTQNESCGKCTFCRVGTKRMLEILQRITEGKGKLEDIDTLYALSENIKRTSLCGLGQTAPNPVLTTLRYFKDEYIAHITEKRCPAGACTALINYSINAEKCIGCTACARKCPVGAITGEVKKTHVIDKEKCVKCGACITACKFNAVEKR